jgi:hypothetical protein
MFQPEIVTVVLYLTVLFFVSRQDYSHMQIGLDGCILLVCLGLLYMVLSQTVFLGITMIILMVMVFGIPCMFGLGLGDLMVFISLAPFLVLGNISMYLFLFFITWIFWHIILVYKNNDKGLLQGLRSSLTKKAIMTQEYPLIPVVLISFIIWLFLLLFQQYTLLF